MMDINNRAIAAAHGGIEILPVTVSDWQVDEKNTGHAWIFEELRDADGVR